MRLSSTIVLLLLCGAIAHQPAGEVPTIPIAKTIEELRKVEAIKLPDGREVRIAMTEPTEGAPWRLVFCLPVDPKAPIENPDGDPEEWLGPVHIRLGGNLKTMEVSGSVQQSELNKGSEGATFYCTAVSVAERDSYTLEVVGKGKDGPVLMRSTFEVKEPLPCYWHQFAERDGASKKSVTVAAKPVAMRPRYSGMSADAWPGDVKAAAPLDGIDPIHKLELSLDLSVVEPKLTIKSNFDMINSPGEHLLARWWVNGKPVVAPMPAPEKQKAQNGGWQISFSKEMSVPFALPRTLGDLKVGDVVKLQLMYSPAGSKPVSDGLRQQMQEMFVPRIVAHPATLPRLSDVLEITVTADMLRGGA